MVSPINILGSAIPGRSGAELQGNRSTGEKPVPVTVKGQDKAPIRTPEDAINVLRKRLEQQLEQRLGSAGPDADGSSRNRFEPPTAADVASRVLGFVQQRLQKEAAAGADPERLAGLLSDARLGVEQGFSEAREQIEALGLMSGKLNSDIDDSFSRIQSGLAELESRYLKDESPASLSAERITSAVSVESASRDRFEFEVTTLDGDRVTVRMEEQRYSGLAASYTESDGTRSAEESSASFFSGRYSFSVEGDIDEGERQALTELFANVQEVSRQFFDGDVQGAFRAAQSLSLGGDELASFSLSLSATRMVSAAAYESISREPSASSQLRPLGGLARDIQQVAAESAGKGLALATVESLMQKLMDDVQALQEKQRGGNSAPPRSLMDEFLNSVLAAFERTGTERTPA
ncbi:DUF5610 domain-containing protein [Marinobacter sp. TBZ242]|uniref:DUF5610 domain-containing protein n=1 Tax=Marinobacter azerbaijanicus TaxID=3050455 RepID=A0ABT7IEQ9_9GAMM|nr:DUF5610 domain-containing protein [Marinobacter sp. TBZ242]MDL0432222.1 DUF5610 domain-containing protein [Marinobacter sp. TBZ242]